MKRLVLLAACAAVLVGAAAASAAVVGSEVISPNPSPFLNCSNQGFTENYANAEVEPWVAVDPRNSAIAAAWHRPGQ